MAFLRLVILGPPGSGKGTIGKLIASTYQLQHISSGDALRDHVNRGTDIGQKVKEYIDKGNYIIFEYHIIVIIIGVLVSDDLITKLMISEIECNKNNRWILDGYPRTLNQGETLYNRKCLEAVLYLNVPFDTIIDRIKDRWVHAPSGRVYNLLYNPPKTHGKDDLTGKMKHFEIVNCCWFR